MGSACYCLESVAMSVLIMKLHHKLFFGPAASCLGTAYFRTDNSLLSQTVVTASRLLDRKSSWPMLSIKLCLGIVSDSEC